MRFRTLFKRKIRGIFSNYMKKQNKEITMHHHARIYYSRSLKINLNRSKKSPRNPCRNRQKRIIMNSRTIQLMKYRNLTQPLIIIKLHKTNLSNRTIQMFNKANRSAKISVSLSRSISTKYQLTQRIPSCLKTLSSQCNNNLSMKLHCSKML